MIRLIYLTLLCSLIPLTSFATEQAAQNTNLNCIACHYSPSGGPRNIRGRYYQRTGSMDGFEDYLQSLKSKASGKGMRKGGAGGILQALVDTVTLQGDFETYWMHTFDKPSRTQRDNFYLMQAQIALAIDIHENLSLVWANDLNDFANTDAYILWRGAGQLHFRAGRIQAPFGLQLRDHTTLIRSVYGLQSYLRDTGFELGWDGGGWFANVAVLNAIRQRGSAAPANTGTLAGFDSGGRIGDENEGIGVVVNAGQRTRLWDQVDFMGGASFLWEQTHESDNNQDEILFSLYSAIKWWRFILLNESAIGWDKGMGVSVANGGTVPVNKDAINAAQYLGGARTNPDFGERSSALHIELIMLIDPKMWDISFAYEHITPLSNRWRVGQQRFVFASRMYPTKNLYFEPQYRLNIEPVGLRVDNDQFLILLGAYF